MALVTVGWLRLRSGNPNAVTAKQVLLGSARVRASDDPVVLMVGSAKVSVVQSLPGLRVGAVALRVPASGVAAYVRRAGQWRTVRVYRRIAGNWRPISPSGG